MSSDSTMTLETVACGTGPASSFELTEKARDASTAAVSTEQWGTIRSPIDALAEEERLRIRNYAGFCVALLVGSLGALPLVGGSAAGKIVHAIGLAVSLVGASHTLYHSSSHSETRKDWLSNSLGFVTIPALVSGYYFWGDMSPATAVVPFGVIVFGLAQSFRGALAVWLLCAVPLGALSGLIAAGVVEDRGLISAGGLDTFERIAIAGLAQFIFAASFVITRQMRRASLATVESLHNATRDAAMRQALLAEAHERLREVAHVGGPGRFTDQSLGPYRLGLLIGRGAMGEVYEARHRETDQRAAVKVLSQLAITKDNLRRFTRETTVCASLDSPNVVAVHDVSPPTELVPYLAMELLQGDTLRDHLRTVTNLSPEQTLDMVRQVGDGLACAHASGVVHRDLKPANVFRHAPAGAAPTWKVLDFGVSKLADGTGTMTQGNIIGTPGYMPPEQARGLDVGPSADLYALSAIVYRCLTGRPPFSGSDPAAVIYDVVHTMPPRPSAQPNVPAAVDDVLAIGLAKNYRDRFLDVAQLYDALKQALTGTLPDDLRERATRLQTTHPWGAERRSRRGEPDEAS